MLYYLYELGHAMLAPARSAAGSYKTMLDNPFNPVAYTAAGRRASAAMEVMERVTRRYEKPAFNITQTLSGGETIPVGEDVIWEKPFCRLIRFRRHSKGRSRLLPKVLIVAPMSGHHATLLRGTAAAMMPGHDVYITDWTDARLAPPNAGAFDLNVYIDYIIELCRLFGGDVHIMAVCQPAPPVLAAVAHMAAIDDPSQPRSMILMGGPIDTRINPTAVNELARQRGTDWFRNTVITTVPWPSPGFGRRVYPGFLQLTGFMSMNLDRHVNAHKDLFRNLVKGDGDSIEKHTEFYDEYLSVMDLTAEFYLQTVDEIFVKNSLPQGEFRHEGRPIDCGAIGKTALLTIEGEKDDITGLGQCQAAHGLCKGLPERLKAHYVQPGVGHYGIFNGARYQREIVPVIARFIKAHRRAAFRLQWRPILTQIVNRLKGAMAGGVRNSRKNQGLAALRRDRGVAHGAL